MATTHRVKLLRESVEARRTVYEALKAEAARLEDERMAALALQLQQQQPPPG